MRHGPIHVIASMAFVVSGCWRTTTTEIRVRDPGQIVLEKQADPVPITVVPAGPIAASFPIATGRWFEPFQFTSYEIRAVRDHTGSLWLHCDACGKVGYPLSGITDRPLVSARGEVAPTIRPVEMSLNNASVIVSHDSCFVTAPGDDTSFCEADVRTRLVIPWANVGEIHRHHEPPRVWGKWLVGMGVFGLALGAMVLSPVMNKLDTADRAGFAVVMMVPASAFLAAGLWNLFAPARDDYIRPSAIPATLSAR